MILTIIDKLEYAYYVITCWFVLYSCFSLKESKGANSLDAGTEWKTKQGVYIGSFVMVEDCLTPLGRPPTESCITELLTKPCSKLDFARLTKQMIKFDTAMVRMYMCYI